MCSVGCVSVQYVLCYMNYVCGMCSIWCVCCVCVCESIWCVHGHAQIFTSTHMLVNT